MSTLCTLQRITHKNGLIEFHLPNADCGPSPCRKNIKIIVFLAYENTRLPIEKNRGK
jgi:hypothetical protein